MFKRAIITDEITQDFEHAVEIACRFRLDGVELRSIWDKNPHELSDQELLKVKQIVEKAGLKVPCIAAPVFKCNLDQEQEYQEHVAILKRSVMVAQMMGASFVRGFTFWDDGRFEENTTRIITKLKSVEPILADSKVVLVIEYDPATSANSSQKLAKILQQVASSHIRALWDPGNNLYVTGAEQPYPQGYERLKPYIAHIHVKDIRHGPATGTPEACCLGEGEVGFREVFRRLVRDHYQGWLSMETHYRKRGPLSDELLAVPKGSAFSMGGEEASIESLEIWNRILDEEGFR